MGKRGGAAVRSFLLPLASVVLLWGNFGLNLLSMANFVWFDLHQRGSESLVVGRLLENKKEGPGSQFGMMGWLTNATMVTKRDRVEGQYRLYSSSSPGFTNFGYDRYSSQFGGQAVLLNGVDHVVETFLDLAVKSKIARSKFMEKVTENKVVLLQLFVALVNAIIVSLFIFWFALEFGYATGWVLLLLTLSSPWLTVFGRNLYWLMGTWYLPAVISAWLCWFWDRSAKRSIGASILFLAGIFGGNLASVFLKATMGYEYLSTITLAQMTIIVFYVIKWNWGWIAQLFALGVSGTGAVAGFSGALWIHFNQLKLAARGQTEAATQRLSLFVGNRMIGDVKAVRQEYGGNASGNVLVIVAKYLFGVWNLFLPFFLFLFPFGYVAWHVIRTPSNEADRALRPPSHGPLSSQSLLRYSGFFSGGRIR